MKNEKPNKSGMVVGSREYNGGMMTGFGLGIVTTLLLFALNQWLWYVAAVCILSGFFIARPRKGDGLEEGQADDTSAG